MSGDFGIGSNVWPGTAKIIEETGELAQVLGKLIAIGGDLEHWDGTNLGSRLEEEIADVMAALQFFIIANKMDVDKLCQRAAIKTERFNTWHKENVG